MLTQSSSSLVEYVNYLIVISININENYRSKRKFAKKKNKYKKQQQGSILISQNYITLLFNIQMTKCKYSWIFMKILEIIDRSQKKLVGISQLLDALNYQTPLLIDAKT